MYLQTKFQQHQYLWEPYLFTTRKSIRDQTAANGIYEWQEETSSPTAKIKLSGTNSRIANLRISKTVSWIFFSIMPVSATKDRPVSRMVDVNGASLEYLDWGGAGPPMVFLAGACDTPYIFNELAPEFTSQFHAYGLTRRGHGRSEKTSASEGYTLDALVDDIAVFLRNLKLTNVTLVGHSFGGTEAVRFAQIYPDVVRRVVVFDIAYAYQRSENALSRPGESQLERLFMLPEERHASLGNCRTFLTWIHRSWSEAAEANLREQVKIAADGRLVHRVTPIFRKKLGADRHNRFLTQISVPALFIFCKNPTIDRTEGLAVDAVLMKTLETEDAELEAQRQLQIDAIRRDSPQATIVELDHTSHRNFIHRRDRTIKEMQQFLR